MSGGLWQRLDGGVRAASPAALTLFLVLIGIMPLQIPHYGPVAPLLPLLAIFYWVIHRPDLLPFWVVFLAGVLHGALVGAPIGLHAVLLLLCQVLLTTQRRFFMKCSFLVLWWGFVVFAVFAFTLEWLAFSFYHMTTMPAEPLAFRFLLTAALFPLATWGFLGVQRAVLPR